MISIKSTQKYKRFSRLFSGENLSQKASLNALAAMMDYGARLVVGFLINPILVAGLGDYGYGVWQFLGRLIGYLSPATGRPTQALKWVVANNQASTDYDFKRRQVGNAIAVWLLFIPLLLLIGGVLTWFAPIWLDAPAAFTPTVRLSAVLLTANLIMVSLVEVPRSVLEGENLAYKRIGLTTALVFLGGGLMVLATYLDTGLVGVSAAKLTTTVLTGLLFLQVVRSYVPWFSIAKPSIAEMRQFLGMSGWFLVWNLVMKLMLSSDIIILGIFASPVMVTSYTLTRYVPETIISFVSIMVFGALPGLGKIVGAGDFLKVIRVRGEIMMLTWLLVTAIGATVLVWNSSFLNLWVGPEYDAGSLATLLIIMMVMQFVFIRNDANIIDLTLNLRHKVLIGLLSASISLLLAAVLVGYFEAEIVGLCLGFLIGRSILSVSYPWLIGRHLNIPFSSQLKPIIQPAIITILLFAIALTLQGYVLADSWILFILGAGLTLFVILPLAFFMGLSGAQRNQILSRARSVVRAHGNR